MQQPISLDVAESARMLRVDLKAAFPSVTFKVRTSRFSMGTSIDVHWTDGPPTERVECIAHRYMGGTFDGATDSYNYRTIEGTDGTLYRGGAKFVSCTRHYTADALERGRAAALDYWGGASDERIAVLNAAIRTYNDGTAYVDAADYRTQSLIVERLDVLDWPAEATDDSDDDGEWYSPTDSSDDSSDDRPAAPALRIVQPNDSDDSDSDDSALPLDGAQQISARAFGAAALLTLAIVGTVRALASR